VAKKGNPRNRGPRRAYWSYDDVSDGRERRGWIASDLYVVTCHRTNAHRPCLREFEHCKQPCDGCKRGIEPEEMGYLAVFRDDGFPNLLTLHEHTHEEVAKLSFGTPIKWSRRGGVGEPVAVFIRADGQRWTSTLPERQFAADLVPFLAHLWGMDDLLPHIRSYFESSDKPLSLPVAESSIAAEIPGTPQWVRGVQDAGSMKELGVPFTEVRDRLISKAKARDATKNGTGH